MEIERIYVECACGSPDHLVSFGRDADDVWVNVQMNPFLPAWRRVVRAVRYVLGLESGCHWTDALLGQQDRERIIAFLSKE